ncbi:hypothetical protein K1719_004800 [Acacia pycnantha]|nr:hypothetical protein K1719_004800 [Acacia pycnantha]
MGGKIDHSKNNGGGPYSFVMSGMNYHNIGSLLPPEGSRPVYSQLYILDTENEVSNRISAVSKFQQQSTIDAIIVDQIKKQLDEVNPFVQQYRVASTLLDHPNPPTLKMCLISTRQNDGRTYNMPDASEVAALVVGDIDMAFNVRDIIVEKYSGKPQRINELHASYLPLQYPILFPFGEDGYRDDIEYREGTLSTTKTKKRLSMREFFSYRLMTRLNEISTMLHASRLLQQFIVDGYTMIESQRLLWVRTHQKELKVDLYQGLADAVLSGETNGATIGKRIILPSSFTGGARYMMQNYQDAMAICRSEGYPDLFLTFTYRLMKTIKDEKTFGTIRADIYTIEFQKRGLPHAHILLFLDPNDKIKDPEAINNFICVEIPDNNSYPLMYKLVRQFMLHGPCGRSNIKAPCMKNQKCSKYFPKKFTENTTIDEDGYPTYRRRDNGRTIKVKGIPLGNRYVVPYNPLLLQKFHAHINIEKCNHSTAIKYLFKYIRKGNDRVVAAIFDGATNEHGEAIVDEIKQYYNCRYISACEGSWRIFGYNIHHRNPSSLCISQFLAWMEKNKTDEFVRTLTYIEFPKHYVYQRNYRAWKRRKKGSSVGRITHVSPSSRELYYLRVLLTKVRGPRTFDEIKTVDGFIHNTFKDACFAKGLLDDDQEYISAIKEASIWASGHSLRKLFVSMLLCFSLQRLDFVWKETSKLLSEDVLYIHRNDPMSSSASISEYDKEQVTLKEIDSLLRQNGKSLLDFPTMPLPEELPPIDVSNQLILQELNYDKHALQVEANNFQNSLNLEQKQIFNNVMSCLQKDEGGFLFVYGCGGTGKTFLWNALTSSLRAKGQIVLAVASSGIAATLLPSGRTAHSRAILAPTIEMVNCINDHMCSMLPGETYEFLSCDSICESSEDSDTFDNLYTTEFLNTISCSGMPPHKLTLKVGEPIMLLRNIDQSSGLCNGTRLLITQLGRSVIEAITLNGSHPNQKVLIHRMDMNPSESRRPFRMKRRQFPIALSFAMTINKSQGQSLRHVGLYLCKPVFTHGQLYVALSRVKSMDGLKIVVDDNGCGNNTTRNVVYKEIFRNLN